MKRDDSELDSSHAIYSRLTNTYAVTSHPRERYIVLGRDCIASTIADHAKPATNLRFRPRDTHNDVLQTGQPGISGFIQVGT
jgi:hypothetical protein